MCDCRKNIEQQLKEHHAAQAPDARGHEADLTGYAITFGKGLSSRPYMAAELTAIHPLKKGGEKSKTKKINMFFSFCPFCGVALEKDEQPKAAS